MIVQNFTIGMDNFFQHPYARTKGELGLFTDHNNMRSRSKGHKIV